MPPIGLKLGLVTIGLTVGLGCAAAIDNAVVRQSLPAAMASSDLGMSCVMGESISGALEGLTSKQPHKALILTYTAAGMCAERELWAAELTEARIDVNWDSQGPARIAERKDARFQGARAQHTAARRFLIAFEHFLAAYGYDGVSGLGERCPKLKGNEELLFLMGLTAGLNALLHDQATGGRLGVPVNTILDVARAAECVDSDKWWGLPDALIAAAGISVPGTDDVDSAWRMLGTAAEMGDTSGVRLAAAMQAMMASNNGRTDLLAQAIERHGASLDATDGDPRWQMLDAYATAMIRHQSDLLWVSSEGHRTPPGAFGTLPRPATEQESESEDAAFDPFGGFDSGPEEESD